MKESTSMFKVVEIIHDNTDDGFAIAKGYWNGEDGFRLACRWYEDGGIGYPQTFGKPQWMMLPGGFKLNVLDALTPANKTVIQLTIEPQPKPEPKELQEAE